ncbi:MAG: thioredoxin fold domain-containing protein [Deltaproteobacteria bacterium]|nr:thioredoxin fold domain-containing protein [Deltaproteobacteria bacterium]
MDRKRLLAVAGLAVVMIFLLGYAGMEPAAAPSSETHSAKINWMDYKDGLEKAKKENKLVFVDFTADYCGVCVKMEKDVFSKQEVAESLNQHYVAVRVNTVKDRDLAVNYQIRGIPTFWMLSAKGDKLGRIIGYMDADQMIKMLKHVKEKFGENK